MINVPDLYSLDEPGTGNNPRGFIHDRAFDDKYRYQTRSVLAVPMISARAEVIGVIQLINKRAKGYIALDQPADFEDGVVPFDDVSVAYVSALASQAGIALENVLLYEEVKTLFDSFVKASVSAIESRDPDDLGPLRARRELTVGLARGDQPRRHRAVSRRPVLARRPHADRVRGPAPRLRQGRGPRVVLVKAKKLYEHERELIQQRFQLIKRGYQIEGLERRVRYLMEASRDEIAEQLATADRDVVAKVAELDDIIKFILASNEPTVLEQGGFERIAVIAGMSYNDDNGAMLPFLSPIEASSLQIRRGSLTEDERLEINSHVVHTFNFLRKIPWSRTLRDVPEIAGAHHEKLDGSGYPRKLRGEQIPVPARMMAISDIYDALTASDRPYKKAMPVEKALDILGGDVKRGQLDVELFDVFVGARVWEKKPRAR